MTAFCRVKLFEQHFDLFELLERHFVKHIDNASGETLVTMFTSHASWEQHIIEPRLALRRQPRKAYNYLKRLNEEFYEHLGVNLIRNMSDINLKGVFLWLPHGSKAHLQPRANVSYMR